VESLSIELSVPRRAFTVDVALEVGAEVVALVGPSGAGKTTVLRAVAGLERPRRGRIALGAERWLERPGGIDLPPERRSVGLVPQDHALFPHLDVRANVAFGIADGGRRSRRRGSPAVATLLERLGIAHLARERPARLSGGERQRVALARALARTPRVLALDEPLGALDAHTRTLVRGQLRTTLVESGLPTLLVTHDFPDAAALAHRVAVIVDGAVVQSGTPSELIARPADRFVAAFTGASVLGARADEDGLALDDGQRPGLRTELRGPVALVLRGSQVEVLLRPPDDGRAALRAEVVVAVVEGPRARVHLAGGLVGECPAVIAAEMGPGREVWAAFVPDEVAVLS
jgi:molybdate transport system ATP-binding protein